MINIITLLASALVVVVSAVFFILLSGFSGLKDVSLTLYNAADPDITVSPGRGKTFLFDTKIQDALSSVEGISAYSKVLDQRAFFHYRDKEHIAYLRGVDEQYTRVVAMDTSVYAGNWLSPGVPYGIVVGNGIASKLSMGIDFIDPVTIYVPKPGLSYNPDVRSLVNRIQTQTIGIFALIEESDATYVYANLDAVQELLEYPGNRISHLHIALDDYSKADEIAGMLKEKLGDAFQVRTREEMNAAFYRMINSENLLLYFISTLMLIMALFNIIGTLIMMIIDKKEHLRTLSYLGLPLKELKKIFVIQGFVLTMAGMVTGLAAGTVLIFLQYKYHFVRINAAMPYPVRFRWTNLLVVIVTITVLGYLSALIASSRINERLLKEN